MSIPDTIPFILDHFKSTDVFTASATQSQGNGLLQPGLTRINSIGTDGDAITLPVAIADMEVMLLNDDSAQYAQLFPNTGAAIDGEGANNPIRISPGQFMRLWATSATQWRTDRFRKRSAANVTASGTQTQAGGTSLYAEVSNVNNVGLNGDAVTLWPAVHGDVAVIANTDAGQWLNLFPAVGDNAGEGTDQPVKLHSQQTLILRAVSNTTWVEIGGRGRRNWTTNESFTADASQTQGTGVLEYGYTRITTVATDGDSLTLPPADRDCFVLLDNTSQNSDAQLFPASGDRIDNGSTNAAITLYAGQQMMLRATDTADWFTVLKTPGSADALTAFSGGGQASATLLAAGRNRLTTVAANGDSVKLPPAQAGEEVWVYNDGNNSADVFPNTADAINDLGNDNAIALAANTGLIFHAFSSSRWNTWGN